MDPVEDVSQHRDAALRKVKTLEARPESEEFMEIYGDLSWFCGDLYVFNGV